MAPGSASSRGCGTTEYGATIHKYLENDMTNHLRSRARAT
jgi:hypothetical protein